MVASPRLSQAISVVIDLVKTYEFAFESSITSDRVVKRQFLQAGTEFKKVATNTLPDKLFGSPAIADGRIYFRGYGYLWAIGAK